MYILFYSIVHASPKATVSWYKNGRLVQPSERILIEKISRKHLFTIKNLDEIQDAGTYTCHAKNDLGEFKENFHLQGRLFSKIMAKKIFFCSFITLQYLLNY